MTWFKVDDKFNSHPKVLRIPRKDRTAAVGLWTLAGTWCAHQLTDGHLDAAMVDELAGSRRSAEHLVAVELWEKTETGYLFHDWADQQPTRAQVEAEREAARERMRRGRSRRTSPGTSEDVRANNDRTSPEVPEQSQRSSDAVRQPRPDPTRSSTKKTASSSANDAVTGVAANAGAIVKSWIDSGNRRPPSQVVGQVSRTVKDLLDENFTAEQILEGLAVMAQKGLNPSTLQSLVNDVVNRPPAAVRQLRPGYSNDPKGLGRIMWVETAPGRWREAGFDEAIFGQKTRWMPPGERPA